MPEIFYEDYDENVARPSMSQMDEALRDLNSGIHYERISLNDL